MGVHHARGGGEVSVQTIDGTDTPLSGWHFVCPCGWTVQQYREPPVAAAQEHHAAHQRGIRDMLNREDNPND